MLKYRAFYARRGYADINFLSKNEKASIRERLSPQFLYGDKFLEE